MGDGSEIAFTVSIPRSALESGPRAEFFSQHNCEQLLGLKPRKFLDLLRRGDAPEVTEIGRTRLVERGAMIAFLRALRRPEPAVAEERSDDESGPQRVLREVGLRGRNRRRVG